MYCLPQGHFPFALYGALPPFYLRPRDVLGHYEVVRVSHRGKRRLSGKIPPASRRSMKKSSIATYSGLRLDLQKGESLIAPGSHRAERGRLRGGGEGGGGAWWGSPHLRDPQSKITKSLCLKNRAHTHTHTHTQRVKHALLFSHLRTRMHTRTHTHSTHTGRGGKGEGGASFFHGSLSPVPCPPLF